MVPWFICEGQQRHTQGQIWIAKSDTDSRPGTDSSWQLAVKAGSRAFPHREGAKP